MEQSDCFQERWSREATNSAVADDYCGNFACVGEVTGRLMSNKWVKNHTKSLNS